MGKSRANEGVVRTLGLGDEFSFNTLIDLVQQRRGRTMRIAEIAELGERGGICALWLSTPDQDIVLHARSESNLHRQQFVLHEIAHMLLGHDLEAGAGRAEHLFPDLPPSTVTTMLARHTLSDEMEKEAEMLADELATIIRRSTATDTRWTEVFG